MGSTELVVMRLLATIEACRRSLDETVKSLGTMDEDLSLTSHSTIWVEHGAVDRIAAYATVLVVHPTLRDDSFLHLSLHNQLSLLTSVEVTETGFQVASTIYATFDWPMGTTPRGSHTLHDHRSDTLTGDEAVVEVTAQTGAIAALDTYQAALGFTVSLPSPP